MKRETVWKKALRLFFLLFLTNLVGYLGSTFITPEGIDWSGTLIESRLTPPNFCFTLVWTVLYFLMGIAGWLVWNKATPRPFVMLLAFNLLWPFLYFYLREPVFALLDIVVMIYFIIRTIQVFRPVSRSAAYLMLPVLLWSMFAFYLNTIIVLYNTQIGVWLGFISG